MPPPAPAARANPLSSLISSPSKLRMAPAAAATSAVPPSQSYAAVQLAHVPPIEDLTVLKALVAEAYDAPSESLMDIQDVTEVDARAGERLKSATDRITDILESRTDGAAEVCTEDLLLELAPLLKRLAGATEESFKARGLALDASVAALPWVEEGRLFKRNGYDTVLSQKLADGTPNPHCRKIRFACCGACEPTIRCKPLYETTTHAASCARQGSLNWEGMLVMRGTHSSSATPRTSVRRRNLR